jgi:hypothetical protein
MREFRPKPFRAKAAPSGRPESSDLTEEQQKAMKAEFDRRIMTFQEKWRLCPGRLCRRKRQCLGPPFTCLLKSWMSPWTNKEYRRLRRDVVRNPPRPQAT